MQPPKTKELVEEGEAIGRNEREKTFAIIVGLLAGVALIIIFVNFIRNVSERDGII